MSPAGPTSDQSHVGPVLVGAAATLAIGLLTADGWPGYSVGVGVTLGLWWLMRVGSKGLGGLAAVTPEAYAIATVGALLVGYFLVAAVGGGNPVWWLVGFLSVGAVAPWAGAVVPDPDA